MSANHNRIVEYLQSLDADIENMLDLNDLDSFNECDINQTGAVYLKKSGHILRGSPSPNVSGKHKAPAIEKRDQDKKIQALVKEISDQAKKFDGDKEDLILELMFGSIVESKTAYELDAKLKAFGGYFIGKKQTITNEDVEDKKLVIQFGTPETTQLLIEGKKEEVTDESN